VNSDFILKLHKSYESIANIYNEINSKMSQFITKANELVDLSEDDYQIEKTFRLNKISLKGFVLSSPCCVSLSSNGIANYSIAELKNYLIQYETTVFDDCAKYHLALLLYENIEEIEKLVDSRIDLEIEALKDILPDITNIKNMDKREYEEFYYILKKSLNSYVNEYNLDEQSYNTIIRMLNDIFNFYIGGYPSIPDEYLFKKGDLNG
jgi:hypothetical protein